LTNETYFANYAEGCFNVIGQQPEGYKYESAEGYRAVTSGTPKSFADALRDPKWHESAKKELNDLLEKAMVKVDSATAKEAIANGSDCLTLFPVYEEKIRDDKQIYKR
jgi:hypothetical protein